MIAVRSRKKPFSETKADISDSTGHGGVWVFLVPVCCSGSLHSEEIFCGGSQDVRKIGRLSVYQ